MPGLDADDRQPGVGEVELNNLDQLDQVRHRGGPGEDTGDLMRAFSEVLVSPPGVEILRVDEMQAS